ncbi:MAG TPA: hypothetical protein VGD68_11130, partial [Streptosporangiaceae bacterium]
MADEPAQSWAAGRSATAPSREVVTITRPFVPPIFAERNPERQAAFYAALVDPNPAMAAVTSRPAGSALQA